MLKLIYYFCCHFVSILFNILWSIGLVNLVTNYHINGDEILPFACMSIFLVWGPMIFFAPLVSRWPAQYLTQRWASQYFELNSNDEFYPGRLL